MLLHVGCHMAAMIFGLLQPAVEAEAGVVHEAMHKGISCGDGIVYWQAGGVPQGITVRWQLCALQQDGPDVCARRSDKWLLLVSGGQCFPHRIAFCYLIPYKYSHKVAIVGSISETVGNSGGGCVAQQRLVIHAQMVTTCTSIPTCDHYWIGCKQK